MCYDDGMGNLLGMATGKINYETGAFHFEGAPANAEFEISLAHGSPFSGKLDTAKEDANVITAIHGNVINQNLTGELKVTIY